MRQPQHAGQYPIEELDPPAEALSAEQSAEVRGGSEWVYFSTGPTLYGPLDPQVALGTEGAPTPSEAP